MTRRDISQGVGGISTRYIQEAETWAEQGRRPPRPIRRGLLLAAVLACILTLTAFAAVIFSSFAGDSLVMQASYQGSGIVHVDVTNQSDRDLTLEPAVKLLTFTTQQPVDSTGEEPYISRLTIPAHTTQRVRLDLRRAYDVEALEEVKNDFFYLQLTNDGFLTGQKWSCLVSFTTGGDSDTPLYTEILDDSPLSGALPSLRPYFRNYTPDGFARWPDAFDYMELVEAELAAGEGNLVRSVELPLSLDYGDWMASGTDSAFDGYNKLLGRDQGEKITQICVMVPRVLDNGEFNAHSTIPLFYLYTYRKSDIQSPEDLAFVRGNLLSFRELEPFKVYEDDEYVIYETHRLVYTDLSTYIQEMLIQQDDVYFNDQVWERIRRVYDQFSDPDFLSGCFYLRGEARHSDYLSMDDLIRISRKGEGVSYEDFRPYRGTLYPSDAYPFGTGFAYVIDGNYLLMYRMNTDGTPSGWDLIHVPTGDEMDIRQGDVAAFVAEHGQPQPLCGCADGQEGVHGWRLTVDYLLEKGNAIASCDLENACRIFAGGTQWRYPVEEDFYVTFLWSEEEGAWSWWLIHTPTGDGCNLNREDLARFLTDHGA